MNCSTVFLRLGVAIGAWLLVGCAPTFPRTVIKAPSATAPLQDRLIALKKIRPLKARRTVHTSINVGVGSGGTWGSVSRRTEEYLQLGSGQIVTHPMDLLPVVDLDSPTAVAARIFDEKVSSWKAFKATINTAALVGLAGLLGGSILALANDDLKTEGAIVAISGAGLALTAVLIGYIFNPSFETAMDRARGTAFDTYGSSVLEHLNLCPKDDVFQDCTAGAHPIVRPSDMMNPSRDANAVR